jgi:DNA-binding NtrC family response regulator
MALPTSQDCQLVVIEGPDQGLACGLSERVIVGSGAQCDLPLTDGRVSERHFMLEPTASGYRLEDLGSTNGVLYEGGTVKSATLTVGATLKIGHSFLRIQPISAPLEVQPSQASRFGELVGESLIMRELFAVLELASQSDATVLIEGETGTGKELAARALHEASQRRKAPFVVVDCGALPESLLESELFGHVRGAFTGATNSRQGAFAKAEGGTIFLDELGRISAAVQARLLRVIEERKLKPVGSDDAKSIDVRILGASRHDLDVEVADGSFRADLFYRLSVLRVKMPDLRSRREDIPSIVEAMCASRGFETGAISGPNLDRLTTQSWPGNVRELRNVVDRALALSPGASSFAELRIPGGAQSEESSLSVRSDLGYAEAKEAVLHTFERKYLADAFARCDSNIAKTARDVGLDRKHLATLLKKHGLR